MKQPKHTSPGIAKRPMTYRGSHKTIAGPNAGHTDRLARGNQLRPKGK